VRHEKTVKQEGETRSKVKMTAIWFLFWLCVFAVFALLFLVCFFVCSLAGTVSGLRTGPTGTFVAFDKLTALHVNYNSPVCRD